MPVSSDPDYPFLVPYLFFTPKESLWSSRTPFFGKLFSFELLKLFGALHLLSLSKYLLLFWISRSVTFFVAVNFQCFP